MAWLDGRPHPLSEDRGRVVLVRWWTDTCPFCANSAPAFGALAEEFGDELRVRAVYHNKVRGRPVDAADVKRFAAEVGYPFLVGHDEGWRSLDRWWLGRKRSFTSVTFLLDRRGRIRLVHSGGEFHGEGPCVYDDPAACRREFDALRAAVRRLAAEAG